MESIVDRIKRHALLDRAATDVKWSKDSDNLAVKTQAAVSERRLRGVSPWRETWSYK